MDALSHERFRQLEEDEKHDEKQGDHDSGIHSFTRDEGALVICGGSHDTH